MPTEIVIDASRLLASLASSDQGTLLHVAAHCQDGQERPLTARGIGMKGDGTAWMTAQDMGKLKLSGSHVSMRACLSGVVTQITSREALGLIWALLGTGAASLCCAAWSVYIPSARRYFEHFYDAWLKGGESRAAAHRAACLALRAESRPFAHPYHWAPFSLTIGTAEGDVV